MKLMWTAVLVAGLVAVAGSAFAGSACCASKEKDVAKTSMMDCSKATAGLDLTAEQKAKIAEIQAACKAGGCSQESCAKAKEEIRNVLTDAQKATFDASWEKCSAKKSGGCSK